jgi:hypothetical protein
MWSCIIIDSIISSSSNNEGIRIPDTLIFVSGATALGDKDIFAVIFVTVNTAGAMVNVSRDGTIKIL